MKRERMRILVTCMAVLAGVAAAAPAEEGGGMHDPFFPSASRPKGPVAAPDDLKLGRDPFANPLGRPSSSQPRATAPRSGLTGIIYGKQSRIAIFNGEVLAEGSVIGDKRIVDIRKRSVLLMSPSGGYEEVFLEDFTLGR